MASHVDFPRPRHSDWAGRIGRLGDSLDLVIQVVRVVPGPQVVREGQRCSLRKNWLRYFLGVMGFAFPIVGIIHGFAIWAGAGARVGD